MLRDFLLKRLKTARYKILRDGTYFGEIPGVRGVWANARDLEGCRHELSEVLEDWVFLKIREGGRVPGLRIKVDRRELVKNA